MDKSELCVEIRSAVVVPGSFPLVLAVLAEEGDDVFCCAFAGVLEGCFLFVFAVEEEGGVAGD